MRNIVVALSRLVAPAIVTAFVGQSSFPAAATGAPTMPGFEYAKPPSPMPDISFADAKGRALTLEDFRGKVVLLNIWATWCPPCVREMPSLDRLQARLGGPRFEVVALSQDRGGLTLVSRFFERLKLKHLDIYIDRTERSRVALGVSGLPTTILIDRDGNEVGRMIGPAEWDSDAAVAVIRHYIGESRRPMDAAMRSHRHGNDAIAETKPRAALGLAEGFGPEDWRVPRTLNASASAYRPSSRRIRAPFCGPASRPRRT